MSENDALVTLPDTIPGTVKPVRTWIPHWDIEPTAQQQLRNLAALPWVFHHIAVMPDVHWGNGATVGSVIAMKDALAPAAVGVDIGCGMIAAKTNITAGELPDNLSGIRSQIERDVPVGFNAHERLARTVDRMPLWDSFNDLDSGVKGLFGKARIQLGTLGGGNHFIEICLDESDNVWVMLHSGSRNIGKTLAEIHIGVARTLAHNQELPDRDQAVFLANTREMAAYRFDLTWAQEYARLNRFRMLDLVLGAVARTFPGIKLDDPVHCHHNYVNEETHFGEKVLVTRKGAISARQGEMGIIPGSMGTGSYIVRGLGNPDSYHSASHGAGRKMSRGAAKRSITLEQMREQTAGVECRKDAGVIDEAPGAYKPIEQVMERQKTLVEVVAKLKQIVCVKG